MSSLKMTRSAEGVALQVFSFLAVAGLIPPLALHWKNRNFPAVQLVGWFLVLNTFNILNAFLWPTDDVATWYDGQGLCDFEAKIFISSYVAVPGSLLCIFRSLANVMDTSRATLVPSKRQRWRNRAMEFLFCILVPLIAAVMHIFYQGNRYYIFAISGCVTSQDESWVSLALGYIWPLVICLIATYYCGLVLVRLHRYRSQFNDIVRSASSRFNKSRFLRLFCISLLMLLALLPMQAYVVYVNYKSSLPWHAYEGPFLSEETWTTIVKVPTGGKVFYDRWIDVAAGFVCFFFFGCGKDASRMYHSVLDRVGLGSFFGSVLSTTTGTFQRKTGGISPSRANLVQKNSAAQIDHSPSTSSTFTFTTTDLEKGKSSFSSIFTPRSPNTQQPSPKGNWLRTHFTWFGHHPHQPARSASTAALTVPTNPTTVQTSAWAGSSQSQSRGSMDIDLEMLPTGTDFIRVKQVIKQEREIQA
ncbi:pheromone A receptor-domain-containing protein [Aspergillus karnatakaensis]|uniref:pheromone receptor n=1 Tax=Aspergillus karnatakaensis TaxID=1810916 RepID=UPI003CCCA80E